MFGLVFQLPLRVPSRACGCPALVSVSSNVPSVIHPDGEPVPAMFYELLIASPKADISDSC